MNCEEALELLSGHIDGQNTAEEEVRLQSHLEACASCREILGAYEEIDAGLAGLTEEPPAALIEGVLGRLDARPAPGKKHRRWFGGGLAAAAAALLLIIGSGMLPDFRPQSLVRQERTAEPQLERALASETAEAPAAEPAEVAFDTAGAAEAPMMYAAAEAAVEETADETAAADYARDAVEPEFQSAGENTVLTAAEDRKHEAEQDDLSVLPAAPAESLPAAQSDEAPEGAELPVVQIVDNPDDPAGAAITELSAMAAETSEADGSVRYCSYAASILNVIAAYEGRYDMIVPDALYLLPPDAPCAVEIVEP